MLFSKSFFEVVTWLPHVIIGDYIHVWLHTRIRLITWYYWLSCLMTSFWLLTRNHIFQLNLDNCIAFLFLNDSCSNSKDQCISFQISRGLTAHISRQSHTTDLPTRVDVYIYNCCIDSDRMVKFSGYCTNINMIDLIWNLTPFHELIAQAVLVWTLTCCL